MFLKTTEEKLEEVEEAITNVLASQELHTGPNMKIARANLASLRVMEEKLQARLGRASGPKINAGIIRRD